MLISSLKKFQLCYGGILTVLLPECHANQTTWSEVDKDLCDRVRQFILELVLSFGCQAAKALSFTDNLTWSDDGSPNFSPDYLHARTSFYTQQLLVAGMVPIIEYQDWWNLDLKTRLHRYLDVNINKLAKNRSAPWRNLASDSAPDMCVGLSFKLTHFDLSDNKSDDRLEIEVRSDGIKLKNFSTFISKHEAMDPGDVHHVSLTRGY